MPAEHGWDHRQVRRDVVHPGVKVAHKTVTAFSQSLANACYFDPTLDPCPGAFVSQIARNGAKSDAAALERVRHLRERATTAVSQPLSRTECGVVHRLARLEVDKQDRRPGPLGDRHDHRGCHVGGQEADDEVATGFLQALSRRPRARPPGGLGAWVSNLPGAWWGRSCVHTFSGPGQLATLVTSSRDRTSAAGGWRRTVVFRRRLQVTEA